MNSPFALLALVPALAVIQFGCVIPVGGAEVGDLRVTWSFDGSQRCAEVGVDTVTIQLIEKGKEGQAGAKAFGQTADCIAGSMVLLDVVAGTYVLTAVGTGEVAVFDNAAGLTIDVVPNQLTEVSAPLELRNGEVVSRVEFQYSFAGEAVCSAANVTTINAQVIDVDGLAIAGSTTACINGLAVIEGIRVGEHTLQVEAVDGVGNVRFVGAQALVDLLPGETQRLPPIDLAPALADYTVNFSFDPPSCADAGIATVDVQIAEDSGEKRVIAAQNVACVDGRASFTNMPLGSFTVRADGKDGNNDVLFSVVDAPLVVDGLASDFDVVLTPLRAVVTIPFNFGADSCADVGVANVDIQITDADGNTTGVNVACIAGDSGPLVVAPGPATIRIAAITGEDVLFDFAGSRDVAAGESVLASIPLEIRRGTFVASWDFNLVTDTIGAGGGPVSRVTTSCSEADIDTVIVRVFRGAVLELAQAVNCDDGRIEMPALLPGDVRVQLEGVREQEGDAPFFVEDVAVTLAGLRSEQAFRLEPAIVFAQIVWDGDCAAAGATTVDIQVQTQDLTLGVNLPCIQASQKIALPAGSDASPVTVTLRGVDGQGVADPATQTTGPITLVPGTMTIRFSGPN